MDYDNIYAQSEGQYQSIGVSQNNVQAQRTNQVNSQSIGNNFNPNNMDGQNQSSMQNSGYYQNQNWPGYYQYQLQYENPNQDRMQQRNYQSNQDRTQQMSYQVNSDRIQPTAYQVNSDKIQPTAYQVNSDKIQPTVYQASSDRIQPIGYQSSQDQFSQWSAQPVSTQNIKSTSISTSNDVSQSSPNSIPVISQGIAQNPQNNQSTNIYVKEELISLNEAINLIKKSVADEKADEEFYDTLIKMAPNIKSKEIITSIRDDEKKHNQILRDVYFRLTGMRLPSSNQTSNTNNYTSNNLNQNNVNTLNSSKSVVSNSSTSNNSKSTTDNTMLNSTNSYKNNLVKALFGETEAVAKYRRIMGAMNDNATYTLLMSIMTDEIRHAAKYNYLIATA